MHLKLNWNKKSWKLPRAGILKSTVIPTCNLSRTRTTIKNSCKVRLLWAYQKVIWTIKLRICSINSKCTNMDIKSTRWTSLTWCSSLKTTLWCLCLPEIHSKYILHLKEESRVRKRKLRESMKLNSFSKLASLKSSTHKITKADYHRKSIILS